MDGLNIYLGLGIVLILAACLGEVEALGVRIPPLRSKPVRVVLGVLGVVAVVAAFVAPLPGTAAAERKERTAAYQRQVLAACADVSSTRKLGDDALRLDERGRILRDPTVALFERQIAQEDAALAQLFARETPADLRAERDAARAEWAAALTVMRASVARIRALPPAFTQQQMDAVAAGVDAEAAQHWSRFRSAMSALAGETCALPA
ncbi:hypothetical protein [Micromonospora auratinigra]|uniref:Uncharacterized protein n=1 Tax=Micromonospora auratinigra TaxID=261654 RepID=A0A1A9A8H6_9ACTN|nr:hypothetical protein [Micromonospora auratinigra]SBT52406.1 hypothetical protein GA0070611_5620 [Micromonospora auratinigra]